jgi:hypothetical protein
MYKDVKEKWIHLQGDADELGKVVPLWNLPEGVVHKIVEHSAGDRLDWLDEKGDGEADEWSPYLSGLTQRQCLSTQVLHSIGMPSVTSYPALLVPSRRFRGSGGATSS